MFKKILILTALLYSYSVAAEECKIINSTGGVSFDNLRICALQHQIIRGKRYAVAKSDISFTANCENVSKIGVSYHAKDDGISYELNEGKGFYTLAIQRCNINGRSAPLTYQDSNHLLPNKRMAFNDTKAGDKNISLTAEVELFIDPVTSVDNISSNGEFIIHSN